MLVYRDHKRQRDVHDQLIALVSMAARGHVNLDQAVDLLVEWGELETGIVDALEPNVDSTDPVLAQLREVGLTTGRLLFTVWHRSERQAELLSQLRLQLGRVPSLRLPITVRMGVSEGYAYYGLYPQMYIESVRRFFDERQPHRVTVVGLRNIGTSLSATVAGTLHELGVTAGLYTVRPHGHPFERELKLAPPLVREWQSASDGWFLIVDEGPGLSGSSLTAAAEAVAGLGVPDERIVLFPGWEPDGTEFISARARARWIRHSKYSTGFDAIWVDSGRLATEFGPGKLTNMSGGKWRESILPESSAYPPVQPQHERAKLLYRPQDTTRTPLLLKFEGLGYYGRAKRERGQVLADVGFSPGVVALKHGFLATEFVPGRPLGKPEVTQDLLERIAEYIAFVRNRFPAQEQTPLEEMVEMISVNTREALGETASDGLDLSVERMDSARAVNLDARMFPHEWLETATGWVKTDGLDHHDDHFYPGSQDSAWDLASACIEFELDSRQESFMLDRYRTQSGDNFVHDRLKFYRIAYLAFRLGYTTMARDALGSSDDARRFDLARRHYRQLLQTEIAAREERM